MNKAIILLLAITAISCEKYHWAVLVAGSDGYSNYRHQSDVCHAYQILIKHGMSPDHIIVMAKDDIANNSRNPIKGKIFNQPDGQDVYAGCKIDYSGETVTPENFMKVLTGDENGMKGVGNGKVLKSDENSNVFIFYSDHGSIGLIAFPDGQLFADEYKETMIKMHEKKMYKNLVFYLEACYSGSMFNQFPEAESMNIYQVSASTPNQSSYACYCGSEAKVGGILIGSCLGDEFSCNWMEHSDAVDFNTFTIGQQVEHVMEKTLDSQVQEYGFMGPKAELLREYQGDYDAFVGSLVKFLHEEFDEPKPEIPKMEKIKNTNMLLEYLKTQAQITGNWSEYNQEIIMQKRSKHIFTEFKQRLEVPNELAGEIDFDCYRSVLNIYKDRCGLNMDRDHSFIGEFAKYCTLGKGVSPAFKVLRDLCSE